jgi:hypothetical protein
LYLLEKIGFSFADTMEIERFLGQKCGASCWKAWRFPAEK